MAWLRSIQYNCIVTRSPLEKNVPRDNANTPQCLQNIHQRQRPFHQKILQEGWHGLKMSDNVWQCSNVSHHDWHELLSQALWSSAGGTIDEAELSAAPLPVTSASTALASTPPAKLCVHSAKVKVWHVTQNLLDWCSDVFWRVMELLVIYAYLCMIMYASCSFFGIESAHHLAFSDSLVGRRIHYRTQSRIHTGLCDSACLQCWCRWNFRSQRCQMRLRQTQSTLSQTSLQKIIDNSVARHGLTKENEDA